MKLNRNVVKLSHMKDIVDDDYVEASIKDRLEMMWDIATELWSISKEGELSAKSRLQRNVGSLKRA
ncbi:MAG: hypothetical protein Q8Q33_06015 [Chlamydiota bacterium]|nr:hypothetical protein [Chlamydiota bacterium]